MNYFKCSICQDNFSGFGNNPQPVKEGRCCDECNDNVVIPTRMKDIIKSNSNKEGI